MEVFSEKEDLSGFSQLDGPYKHRLCNKPQALFSFMSDMLEDQQVPLNVIMGLCTYVIRKQFLKPDTLAFDLPLMAKLALRLSNLMEGQDFYKSNAFRYLSEADTLTELIGQIEANAEFWIQHFGSAFFLRYHAYSKERKTILRSDIDDDFYLSCKGGSGLGTFSIDLAIGMKGRDFALNVPSGEIWRTGIDTEIEGNQSALRIVRSGSGVKGSDEKRQGYETFVKRYKTTPQRLLALLSLYVARDLEVDEVKALSSAGVRNKSFTLLGHNNVGFDYDGLFKGVGFQSGESPLWLTTGDIKMNFYSTLQTCSNDQRGLRRNEVRAMDRVLGAFNALEDITQTAISCPLTTCSNMTRIEVEAALKTFRVIQGK